MTKFFYLLFSLAFFALTTSAQDCRDVKTEKDAFSGELTRTAQITVGTLTSMKWVFNMQQVNGKTIMQWDIAMRGEFNQQLPKGNSMLFKLSDGTVLTLNTSDATSPVTQALNGGAGTINVFTTYRLRFDLSEGDLRTFAASPITDLRVEITGARVEKPKIKESQMEKIQSIAGCLLKTAKQTRN